MKAQLSTKDSVYGIFHWSKGSPWYLASASYTTEETELRLHRFRHQRNRDAHFQPDTINEIRAAWVPRQREDRPEYRFQALVLFPQLPVSDNGGLPTMSMTGYTGMFYDYARAMRFQSTTLRS